MDTEELLAALDTGVWSWDAASAELTVDAEAARLLGLPAHPAVLTEPEVRARMHGVDYAELTIVMDLARADGAVAEARVRVVDGKGRVLRFVRARMHPPAAADADAGVTVSGTLQEIVEPLPGASAGTSPPSPLTSDWRLSREAFLLDAGRSLAEARSTEQVLRVAASLAMPGFTPDGMAVFGVEGDSLILMGYHGYRDAEVQPFTRIPQAADYPASVALRTGRTVYLPTREAYENCFPQAWEYARPLGRRSWAFLPLVVASRPIGVWMASYSHPTPFTPDERSVLTTVARMLAQALSRAQVHESERELTTGVQRSLMPEWVPQTPGMTVAARYVPTGGGLEIGGDWYDVIPLASGRTVLVIGDVQGHDMRAANLMGQLRVAIRAYAAEGHRPDGILTRASRFLTELCEQGTGAEGAGEAGAAGEEADPRFATCLCIQADPATGALTIARAGHLDPAMGLADGTMLVRPTEGGLPLGVEVCPDYPTTKLVLAPGEIMLLCSDGLIETGGHDLDTGRDRLSRAFAAHVGDSLEAQADALIAAVSGPYSHDTPGPHAEHREDDIALVLVRRDLSIREPRPEGGRHLHLTVPQAEGKRVADARHELRAMLYDWEAPDQVDSAELVLSELVANVLLHTDSDAEISADLSGLLGTRTLRVTVADGSSSPPHFRHPGELGASGRGVLLLQELSDRWGMDPVGDGKAIWFELVERIELNGQDGQDGQDPGGQPAAGTDPSLPAW